MNNTPSDKELYQLSKALESTNPSSSLGFARHFSSKKKGKQAQDQT